MRHLKVSEKGRQAREKDKHGSHRHNPLLAAAPTNMIAVNGQSAISTGQASGAEAAIQTEWPVHIEAEPRVRGREAVQRVAVVNSYHHQTNKATNTGFPLSSLLWPAWHYNPHSADYKGAEASLQPKWSVLIVVEPIGKNRAADV